MLGQSAAVYVYPRLISALGMKVESPSDKFFAGTGFPNDEHSRVVVCDALHHLQESFHRLAAKDGLHARQV